MRNLFRNLNETDKVKAALNQVKQLREKFEITLII